MSNVKDYVGYIVGIGLFDDPSGDIIRETLTGNINELWVDPGGDVTGIVDITGSTLISFTPPVGFAFSDFNRDGLHLVGDFTGKTLRDVFVDPNSSAQDSFDFSFTTVDGLSALDIFATDTSNNVLIRYLGSEYLTNKSGTIWLEAHLKEVPPEIAVGGGFFYIADNDATPSTRDLTDFGTVTFNLLGVDIRAVHTFSVENTGIGPLRISSLTLPAGFSLVKGLSPRIPAGGSDYFEVRLDADTVGTKSGDIIIINNDSDEGVFNFRITGTVDPGFTPIETSGRTTLATRLNHFYLQDSDGFGPSLKFGGNDVVAGQFGAWTPIAAESTGSGYEVAWKVTGLDQYSVWSTDANGKYIANLVPSVAGNDPVLVATESFFHQDINGDGQISVGHAPIESHGTTTLALGNSHYYLQDNTGAGPSLKMGGNDVVAGQFGAWTPIAAETTGSGYEVAWKVTGANQYSVWSTDANGNYITNLVPSVTGNDPALLATESFFQQDLNGDGQIAAARTPIETHGVTTLALGNNHYYLQDNLGAGPSLKFGGNDVTAGQFGGWTPIAAEATASGYEVAWKVTGLDQYSVWSTDANGNYLANLVPTVTGNDPALLATESSFQQDLNNDGQISAGKTPIESHGLTTLALGSNHFYLEDNTGAGPTLKLNGSDVVAGQFGGWTPISAETTGSGYEVAWKVTGLDQYSVWNTDANGNYTGNLVPSVAGSNPALTATESFFHQDLNGDGIIS